MKKTIQYLLIVWFIIFSLLIFVPSFLVLYEGWSYTNSTPQKAIDIPTKPEPLKLEALNTTLDAEGQKKQIESMTSRVNAYTQEVSAYIQQLNAYKSYTENAGKWRFLEAYQNVVKDSLVSLFSTLLLSLLPFALTKVGAELVNSYIGVKHGHPPKSIKFFE